MFDPIAIIFFPVADHHSTPKSRTLPNLADEHR
jgi:hypothetical protein